MAQFDSECGSKIKQMEKQLNEAERKLLAFAIFSTSMKVGEVCFSAVKSIVEKIGIAEEFEYYANDWVAYSQRNGKTTDIK